MGKSLDSLSPVARGEIESDMRISESLSKIVFRDFAVPKHNGKGRVDLKSLIKTQPGSRGVSSNLLNKVDIITSHVQTTLNQVDDANASK